MFSELLLPFSFNRSSSASTISGRPGDRSLGRRKGGRLSEDLDGADREDVAALSLEREVFTTMVSGLVTLEDGSGGVSFSVVVILRGLCSGSGGMIRSSGKGDKILGIFKGFSIDFGALVLDSVCFVLTVVTFFGGVDVRGRVAAAF